jgi:glyoxylase-like metal-dependent hydrolase (beta-lactamase superfamily II)
MRAIKTFLVLLVVLAGLAGAAVIAMRVGREKFQAPTEIKPGMFAVKSSLGVFVFAARIGPKLVLFDAGIDPAGTAIDAVLTSAKGSRPDVQDIFLSHGHMDHVAAVWLFPKARTHLGAGDQGLAAGTARPDALLAQVLAKALPVPPASVTNPLTGKSDITVAEGKVVKAIPVGGHTTGSYAFLYDGVLFAGDLMIFKQGHLEPTPAVFDAHPNETRAGIKALKTQLTENDTVDQVCTSHGGCTPKGLGGTLLKDLLQRLGA